MHEEGDSDLRCQVSLDVITQFDNMLKMILGESSPWMFLSKSHFRTLTQRISSDSVEQQQLRMVFQDATTALMKARNLQVTAPRSSSSYTR